MQSRALEVDEGTLGALILSDSQARMVSPYSQQDPKSQSNSLFKQGNPRPLKARKCPEKSNLRFS